MKVSKKVIKATVLKINDLRHSINTYDVKIAALTFDRTTGPLTEGEAYDLKTYREERTNLHGIVTGIWTAAELAGYDTQLTEGMIEEDEKRMKAREDARFAQS